VTFSHYFFSSLFSRFYLYMVNWSKRKRNRVVFVKKKKLSIFYSFYQHLKIALI